MKYAEIATEYALNVAMGGILACKWTIKACERHLSDLEKGVWEYNYDRAHDICYFVEQMKHIKGEWARRGETLKLEPWQIFALCSIFGWIHPDTSLRRFRTVYIEVPRKCAKSTITSAVGLYMLTADGEAGSECYSLATTRDQAKIVFQDARAMARKNHSFRNKFGVDVRVHNINVIDTNSKFEALSADGGTLDGLNIHFGGIDELHAHKTRNLFDVVETGTGSRQQSLLWAITTAGSNRAGICYEQRTYVTKILDRVVEDDTYWGVIYSIDDDDDWTDPTIWEKANPNFGVSVYPEDIARLCRKAQEMPSAVNNFLTKRLNVWVNADTAWMDMRAWDRCADESISLKDFEHEEAFIALDLASKVDMAAKVCLFEKEGMYYLFSQFYLPEDTVENNKNSQYPGWAREDRLTLTPGNVIDLDRIEEDLLDDMRTYDVKEVPYDPFQATQLSVHMIDQEVPMVEMRPLVLNFSEPMKELEALVISGKLKHNGCPIMGWMVSNVVCHRDQKDNIYPRKERQENLIDGVVAAIMALGREMVHREEESVYEKRGLRRVNG